MKLFIKLLVPLAIILAIVLALWEKREMPSSVVIEPQANNKWVTDTSALHRYLYQKKAVYPNFKDTIVWTTDSAALPMPGIIKYGSKIFIDTIPLILSGDFPSAWKETVEVVEGTDGYKTITLKDGTILYQLPGINADSVVRALKRESMDIFFYRVMESMNNQGNKIKKSEISIDSISMPFPTKLDSAHAYADGNGHIINNKGDTIARYPDSLYDYLMTMYPDDPANWTSKENRDKTNQIFNKNIKP